MKLFGKDNKPMQPEEVKEETSTVPEATQETENKSTEVEKTKAEKFAENPDAFIDMRECMVIVLKKVTEKGDSYGVVNNCTSIRDLALTWFHAEESCQNRRDQIRMEQIQKKQMGLTLPGQPGYNMKRNGKPPKGFRGY